jgi:hypothetical protein
MRFGIRKGKPFLDIMACRPVARRRPRNKQPLLSNGSEYKHASTATKRIQQWKRCFLRSPCRNVISRATVALRDVGDEERELSAWATLFLGDIYGDLTLQVGGISNLRQ